MSLLRPALAAFAVTASLLPSAVACNPTVDFDVLIEAEVTVPGGGLVPDVLNAFGLGDLAALDLSTTREFENNDVRKEQVVEARLTLLRLTIVDGSDDFDFLDSLAFSVAADGLDERQVASADVPEGATTFECERDDVDISPYVRADSFAITSDVTGEQPADDTTIKLELNFAVKAEVLGSS